VSFYVIEPPEEEKKVLDEIWSIRLMGGHKTYEEMLNMFYDLGVNHKDSRYLELIIFYMLSYTISVSYNSPNNVSKEQLDFCLWYIDKNSNSNYMPATIGPLIQVIYNLRGGKQGVLDFLNKIVSKYPNTKASKIAYEYLNDPYKKESYMK
jgi:hypothetical protein